MRPTRFFLRTFKGNDGEVSFREHCRHPSPLPCPLHAFKEPDQFVEVIVEVGKQLDGPRSDNGTIRGSADIAQLFQHVQRIADAMGGEIEELGEFHDPDRLVVRHGTGYFKMAAHQFDLVLHLLEHNTTFTGARSHTSSFLSDCS